MNHLRMLILAVVLLLPPGSALSQAAKTPPTDFALSLQMENFRITDGIVHGLYWPSDGITLRIGVQVLYDVKDITVLGANPLQSERSIASSIAPIFGVLKRFLVRDNVSPYVGGQVKIEWFLKNFTAPRFTVLRPAFVFGVEAWVTDAISISGEQALEAWIYTNRDSGYNSYGIGRGTLVFSFYF